MYDLYISLLMAGRSVVWVYGPDSMDLNICAMQWFSGGGHIASHFESTLNKEQQAKK